MLNEVDERREQIVRLVERRGYMSIDRLAEHFAVTPQTIRRDINTLCQRRLLARQHGGASLPSSVVNTAYVARHIEHAAEKERIARTLIEYLPDRASLFMSLGTTVEAVAEALPTRKGMKVVTNSMQAARRLSTATDFEIILTGGVVQHWNGGLTGPRALATIADFRCDFAILGIGAIEPDGMLLDFHDGEAAVMKAMITNARRVLVAADCSKFDRTATVRVCGLRDLAALFTDAAPSPGLKDLADCQGVEIVVAEPKLARPSACG